MAVILITGGARSGKSLHAENLTLSLPGRPIYLATAEAWDDEMGRRIARHRARRGPEWLIREAPLALAAALDATDGNHRGDEAAGPRLVDCLTLWLTNHMLAGNDLETETAMLCTRLAAQHAPVVLVTNEVGLGIVPDNAMARAFRDAQGLLNQRVAALADRVDMVVSGLPLRLKG